MKDKKSLEKYVQMSIGLESTLVTIRDQIYFEIIEEKQEQLSTVESQMKVCTKKDKKGFLTIKKDLEAKISKYKSLRKKNMSSKDIDKMFSRVNSDKELDSLDKFKDMSQDRYAELAELLNQVYDLPYEPQIHSCIIIKDDEGDCNYKGEKYKIIVNE